MESKSYNYFQNHENDANEILIANGSYGKVCGFLKNDQKYVKKYIPIEYLWHCIFEFILLKTIQSPNLNYATEIDMNETEIQVISPYFGNSLDYIDLDELSIYQKLSIYQDISLGLAILHRLDVLHGDLKPENILYDMSSKSSKICDFGLCKKIIEKGDYGVLYSVKCRPIECWLHTKSTMNLKSDIWALGTVFLYVLTGTMPTYFHEDPSSKTNLLKYILSTCAIYDFLCFVLDNEIPTHKFPKTDHFPTISNILEKHSEEYSNELKNCIEYYNTLNKNVKTILIQHKFIDKIKIFVKSEIHLKILELCKECLNIDVNERPDISHLIKKIHEFIKLSNTKSKSRKELIQLKQPSGIVFYKELDSEITESNDCIKRMKHHLIKLNEDLKYINDVSKEEKFLLLTYLTDNEWMVSVN
jgi:serine/threonine protein kinase